MLLILLGICLFLGGVYVAHHVSYLCWVFLVRGVYVSHLVCFLCCVFRFVCLRSMYYAQCFLCSLIIYSFR